MSRRVKTLGITLGIIILGALVWVLTSYLVKKSYSSKEYVENKATEQFKEENNMTEELTTEYNPEILHQEDISDDYILVFIDEHIGSEGMSYVNKAKEIKINQQDNEYAFFYEEDDEGIEVPKGSNGNVIFQGTKLDMLIVYSYEFLRQFEDLESATFIEGMYKDSNEMIYINVGNDDYKGNDIVVISDSAGYPKMYCKIDKFDALEIRALIDKDYKLIEREGYYMFCY